MTSPLHYARMWNMSEDTGEQAGSAPEVATLLAIEDEGVHRGKRCWTVTLKDGRGRAQVVAHGASAGEAEADARRTFATRRIPSLRERQEARAASIALEQGLRKGVQGPRGSKQRKGKPRAKSGVR